MPIDDTLNDSSPLLLFQLFGVNRFVHKLPRDLISHIIITYIEPSFFHSYRIQPPRFRSSFSPLSSFIISITILTNKEYKFKLKNKIRKLTETVNVEFYYRLCKHNFQGKKNSNN